MPLLPGSGIPLIQQIRTHYSRRITSGQLPAGSLLPPVRKLAESLRVNVNTVRLAYQRLEADGLVATSQGVGTRVLGLDPRRLMRLAKSERTNTVGVIVPNVGNPFYASFLEGVEAIAQDDRTMLLVCSTHDQTPELLRSFAQLSAQRIDGAIAASCNLCELIPGQRTASSSLPIVTADWPECPGYSVQMDLEGAGYRATRHLIQHGHRRIGRVTLSRDAANLRPLDRGYARALRESGMAPEAELIARVDGWDMQDGRLGVQALLSGPKPPTAIFVISDLLALGVIAGIRQAGLRVPQDIAVTSIDDISYAGLVAPALTTVRAPAHELGRESMKMLKILMAGEEPPRKKVTLPTSLIIRESCGPHAVSRQ